MLNKPPIKAPYNPLLKRYQIEEASAQYHLSENGLGGILAAEPGLGKTYMAVEWLAQIAQRGIQLILVPVSIHAQMSRE